MIRAALLLLFSLPAFGSCWTEWVYVCGSCGADRCGSYGYEYPIGISFYYPGFMIQQCAGTSSRCMGSPWVCTRREWSLTYSKCSSNFGYIETIFLRPCCTADDLAARLAPAATPAACPAVEDISPARRIERPQ